MVRVRELEIGSGMPKICAPIVESTQNDIVKMAEQLNIPEIDLVEWRIDFYEDIYNIEEILQTAGLLRAVYKDKPILATFRSKAEGGAKIIAFEYYSQLLLRLAKSNNIDIADVEIFTCDRTEEVISEADIIDLIDKLKRHVKVIGSYHDFYATPCIEEIISRLNIMAKRGADIVKMAVMPKSKHDVLTLMQATQTVNEKLNDIPVITMSMGSMGMITRIAGESFGSSVTFGCLGKTSAPGQIDVRELKNILCTLKNEINDCSEINLVNA